MNRKGITLIELITVITIIAMLAAVLLPALGKARQKAKYAVAQRNIDQLVTALTSYASDYGTYPYHATYTDTTKDSADSDYLIMCLEKDSKGPFVSIPDNQKVDVAGDPYSGKSWKDPWGNYYRYRYPLAAGEETPDIQSDCLKRGIQFQIWSIGIDGTNDYGTQGTGNDDITNW